MRIQQMRSGFLHLKKKADLPDPAKIFQMRSIFDEDLLPETFQAAPVPEGPSDPSMALSELDQPIWAVVSFDRIEAGPLTYEEAAARLDELNQLGIAGLCIVTAEAAARMD